MLNPLDFVFSNALALFLLIIGLIFFLPIVLAPPPWQQRKRTRIGGDERHDPLSAEAPRTGQQDLRSQVVLGRKMPT